MEITKNILNRNNIELISEDEVFKQVKQWNKYFISNHGRLLHKNSKGKYRIVNPSITNHNYLTYTLSKPTRTYNNKKVKNADGSLKRNASTITANRLVGLMFVEYNPYKGKYNYSIENLDTHHKDHNPQNNYYKNLMWLSNGQNGTRADHQFVNTIKRIAIYDEKKSRVSYVQRY